MAQRSFGVAAKARKSLSTRTYSNLCRRPHFLRTCQKKATRACVASSRGGEGAFLTDWLAMKGVYRCTSLKRQIPKNCSRERANSVYATVTRRRSVRRQALRARTNRQQNAAVGTHKMGSRESDTKRVTSTPSVPTRGGAGAVSWTTATAVLRVALILLCVAIVSGFDPLAHAGHRVIGGDAHAAAPSPTSPTFATLAHGIVEHDATERTTGEQRPLEKQEAGEQKGEVIANIKFSQRRADAGNLLTQGGSSDDNSSDDAAVISDAKEASEGGGGVETAAGAAAGAERVAATEGNLFDLAGFQSPTTGEPAKPCGRRGGGGNDGGGGGQREHCTLRSWIESDLDPWRTTGISAEAVKRAVDAGKGREINRYVIKDGALFMSEFKSRSKWGDSKRWYNAWALLELLETYPGQVPDVDIAINGADEPFVSSQELFSCWNETRRKSHQSLASMEHEPSEISTPVVLCVS